MEFDRLLANYAPLAVEFANIMSRTLRSRFQMAGACLKEPPPPRLAKMSTSPKIMALQIRLATQLERSSATLSATFVIVSAHFGGSGSRVNQYHRRFEQLLRIFTIADRSNDAFRLKVRQLASNARSWRRAFWCNSGRRTRARSAPEKPDFRASMVACYAPEERRKRFA